MPSASDPTTPIASRTTTDVHPADERMQVLRLLENGELSADEAGDLLDAIDAESAPASPSVPSQSPHAVAASGANSAGVAEMPTNLAGGPGRLRIRVTAEHADKARVNLTVPLGFLDAGYRLARRVAPGRIPAVEELHQRVNSGYRGHLVDVHDDGDRVEILIE